VSNEGYARLGSVSSWQPA